jgi:hypothetical protein
MPTGPELYHQANDLLLSMPTDEELKDDPSLEEQWTEQLIAWADHTQDKVAAYRAVYRSAESRAQLFKDEAARFTAARKREERVQNSIAELAKLLLRATEEATGEAAVDCGDGSKIKLISRKSPKITAINVDELPDVYVIIERKPRKAMIKKVCADGEIPPGVEYDADNKAEWVDWGPARTKAEG